MPFPFFFALSGFLLFHSYSKSLHHQKTGVNLIFYLKRIFRIYPAWAVALLAFAVLHRSDLGTYLWNLFFLFGLKPHRLEDLLAFHAWSLYVEEIFYISFPFLIFIFRKKWAGYGLVLFLLVQVGLELSSLSTDGKIYYHPFNTFPYFFCGMFAYLYLPHLREFAVSKALFYLCLIAMIIISSIHSSEEFTWSYIAFSFLILTRSPRGFSKIFLFLFRRLGRICYSFYLVHPIGMMIPGKIPFPHLLTGFKSFWDISLGIHFILSYALTVGGAFLLYSIVERPFINFGKQVTLRWSALSHKPSFF